MIAALSGGVLAGVDVTCDMPAYVADKCDRGKPSEPSPCPHNPANDGDGSAISKCSTAGGHDDGRGARRAWGQGSADRRQRGVGRGSGGKEAGRVVESDG